MFWPILSRKIIQGTDTEKVKILDTHIINIREIISRSVGSQISFANKGSYLVKPPYTRLHASRSQRANLMLPVKHWNAGEASNLSEQTICLFFTILGTGGVAIVPLFYKAIKKGLFWTCTVMRGLCQATGWFTWATLTTVLNLSANSSLNTGNKQVLRFVFK